MGGLRTWTIWLGAVPPSLNRERGAHWSRMRRIKGQWQEDLGKLLMAEMPRHRTGPIAALHVEAVLRFPPAKRGAKTRRRDEGNFRWMLEKALGDALQEGGWLADDTPEYFTFGALTFDPEPGPARTTITLQERPPAA